MNTIINLQQEFSNQRDVMTSKIDELKGISLLDRIASRGVAEQIYVSPLLSHYHEGQTKRRLRRFKGDKYRNITLDYKRAFK